MLKKILLIFSICFILVASTITAIFLYYDSFLNKNIDTLEVDIEKGENFKTTYNKIFKDLNPPPYFDIYLKKVMNFHKKRKYGYYYAKNIKIKQFLFDIMNGKEYLIKVFVVEGSNVYDVARSLEQEGIITEKEFLDVAMDKQFIKSLTGLDAESIEGMLYPDTYFFSKKTNAQNIIKKMFKNFKRNLPEDFDKKIKLYNLTFYEGVIMASIIQKESSYIDEYPLIASVFYNRLKRNMKLQADPTVIYGIYKKFDGNLTKLHLIDQNNRYNTYIIYGLPPTPICNPTHSALEAVIKPAETKYLYFVTNGNGKHNFAVTYRDHLKNIKGVLE
jgi:UPF0755 protein